MGTAQKFVGGLILIGVITALTLPGRQTSSVLSAGQKFVSGTLHTSITGNT